MTAGELVGYLVTLGIPAAVFSALGAAGRAWSKRRTLIQNAPEQKIDTSLARMQQAAIVQDSLVDNLRDALTSQTQRAESAETRLLAAEARERALLARLADRDPPRDPRPHP